MTTTLEALRLEAQLLEIRRLELCYLIGTIYNQSHSAASFDRAFKLWEAEFPALLVAIECCQRSIARLSPKPPRKPPTTGRNHPRARRVV